MLYRSNLFNLRVAFKEEVLENVVHDIASFHEEFSLNQMNKRIVVNAFAMLVEDLFQSVPSRDHERDVCYPLTETKKSFSSGPGH